jgi:hypothetical protein
VFSKPSITELLNQYTRVELFTDSVPQHYQPTTTAKENRQLQRDEFKTAQLPLYVILKPLSQGSFRLVARYDVGRISDVEGFADFLRRPLSGLSADSRVQLNAAGANAAAVR